MNTVLASSPLQSRLLQDVQSYLRTNKNEDAMNKAIDILEKSTAEN